MPKNVKENTVFVIVDIKRFAFVTAYEQNEREGWKILPQFPNALQTSAIRNGSLQLLLYVNEGYKIVNQM